MYVGGRTIGGVLGAHALKHIDIPPPATPKLDPHQDIMQWCSQDLEETWAEHGQRYFVRASVRGVSRGVWDYHNFHITSPVHLHALFSRVCLGSYGPWCSYPTVT